MKIEKDELERTQPINFDYPRSYDYSITIAIPSGYAVKGIEKFNKETKTPFGGFCSKAEINDNKITITTNKYYSCLDASKEAWPDIVSYLNAAYQFTQEKLLFEKL